MSVLKTVILGCLASAAAFRAAALEVPLKQGSGKGGDTVGVVDMDRIYQEYPETEKAKGEYYKELDRLRRDLAEREKALADLREQVTVMKAALAEAAASSATAVVPSLSTATAHPEAPPPPAPPTPDVGVGGLSEKEQALAEEESSLERARQEAARSLKEFEEKRAMRIFGKLYKALMQLAEEKGVGLVVDKSSILYGRETIDLTEALSRRVRGLPEGEEDGR